MNDLTDGHAGHGHNHVSGDEVDTRRLGLAAVVNVGFAIVQVTVGLLLGSVVVLADALHQVVDAVGLVTALIALALLRRPATSEMSFGWGKADALGGYTSGLLLLASVAWVVYESVQRLFDPVDVDGRGVILIGCAGIAVNGGSVWLLGHGQQLALKA
ncbi:MAG: cation transporter, partial [Acidimicrobiales bacterium]|nr:cation transporter [Acidimicrobiales bacterium]